MTSFPRPSLTELAGAPIDDEDARILHRTARLYESLDPVPEGLIDRISFGITLDALHAEIADLQRVGELTGVRSDEADRADTVTFTSSQLTTTVAITTVSADRVRLDGWIVPGAGVSVELRTADRTWHADADADGRFVLDEVARGYAQFVLRLPDGSSVVTPSLDL